MSLLVHGITDSDAAGTLDIDALRAARGEDVEIVVHGAPSLAAFISRVDDDDVVPTRALLLGHARLIEEIGNATTVLPMRFGTTVPTVEQLRLDVLAAHAPNLKGALDRLRGHVEFRVRGRYDEPRALRRVAREDRMIARLRGRDDAASRIELGERVVAALDALREADRRRVVGKLEDLVTAVSEEAVREPLDVCSIAVLVQDATTFEAKADDLAAELAPAISLELVGPYPPYSFVQGGDVWDS